MNEGGVPVLEGRALVKSYDVGGVPQTVLAGVDVTVGAGEFLAVMGPSGSGKSTLLHLLAGLDQPDSGDVLVDGRALSNLPDDERTLMRRTTIGVVFQFFNLVPVLTVAENVALPAVIAGRRPASYRARLETVLELVALSDHAAKLPTAVSGGQQQRAAIARALFAEPRVLLADEPTGNLDRHNGTEVLELFSRARTELGQTIVMVTHDPRGAGWADRVMALREGAISGHLELAQKLRGPARTNPAHPARARSVLRWLEQLDSTEAPVIDLTTAPETTSLTGAGIGG